MISIRRPSVLPGFHLALGTTLLYLALVVLMGAAWMFTYMYYPGVYASIQDVVPPALRGTAMALYFLAMYLFGGSFGPVLIGKLSDYFLRHAMAGAGAGGFCQGFR